MDAFPSRRRETPRAGIWTNPNPLPKTFSPDDMSKYNKRPYEDSLISYPMQKLPRLERSPDRLLPISPQKPPSLIGEAPFPDRPREAPFPDKPTFEEKAEKVFESETRRDRRDRSPPRVSESWRADSSSTKRVEPEEVLWDEETDRDYPRKAVERDVSPWRNDRRADFEPDRNSRRSFPPTQERDPRGRDFFDTKQKTNIAPIRRDYIPPENRNQGTYEKLMKVVMGSINPRASANPRLTDRISPADGGEFRKLNSEGLDGYSRPPLDAERYRSSRHYSSSSFVDSSLPSSLSGKADYLKDIPTRTNNSSTGPPRWESWRNLSSGQSAASSKALNSADIAAPPSDSWRTGASKSESWRNVTKQTTDNPWVKPPISNEQGRFPSASRDMAGFGPRLAPFERPVDLGARGYAGPRMDRNFRR